MNIRSRLGVASGPLLSKAPRVIPTALTALLLLSTAATDSFAADEQRFDIGDGLPDTICVGPDIDGNLLTALAPGSDDEFTTGNRIDTGPDGVCDTTADVTDEQVLPVGNGAANETNIASGVQGNDNGICDTPVSLLCVAPASSAGTTCTANSDCDSGPPDGVCSDDNILVLPGNSTPNQVVIDPGINDVIDAVPNNSPVCLAPLSRVGDSCSINANCDVSGGDGICGPGDDVQDSAICPGTDNQINSSLAGDDELLITNQNCVICATTTCIMPGADGILDTTAGGDDVTTEIIHSGANGIAETFARDCTAGNTGPSNCFTNADCDTSAGAGDGVCTGNDIAIMDHGFGFRPILTFQVRTTCVDTGADGIADSTVCGSDTTDIAPDGNDEDCDDGNLTDGDGCDSNCTFTGCGNGIVTAGEDCDDGAANSDTLADACRTDCTLPGCGDNVVDTGEDCDDGNTSDFDGCDATCGLEPFCGDGATASNCGAGLPAVTPCSTNSDCDTGPPDGFCRTEDCDDGNTDNNDTCLNNCTIGVCGDSITCSNVLCTSGPSSGPEECDDGNATNGDGCNNDCSSTVFPECGNGLVEGTCLAGLIGTSCTTDSECDTGPPDGDCLVEPCDDGNNSDTDACVSGCTDAVCGDGFVFNNGGPEECDDGNTLSGDGCNSSCLNECGNGQLDGGCTAGRPFGTSCNNDADCDSTPGMGDGSCSVVEDCDRGCGKATSDGECASGIPTGTACNTNADCDTAPGTLDGLCLGSTCGPGCTGDLVASPQTKCTAGNTGASCTSNADCDTGPPDGVCSGPLCDTSGALDLFCGVGIDDCSDASCLVPVCGNEEQECDEECDLGALNGVADSGCESDCTRLGIVGKRELTRKRECHSAWTIDNPPAPINLDKKRQTCIDGAACDGNPAVGTCRFSVGLCFARPGVGSCVPADIRTFELRGVKVTRPQQAVATQTVTEAVRELIPNDEAPAPFAFIPARCRKGLKKSTCDIPNDHECDTSLGKGNGRCDIGTGVIYEPWLPPAVSGSICTDSFEIDVAQGDRLRLKSVTSPVEGEGKPDRDKLILECD